MNHMNHVASEPDTQNIVVDELLPHAPETVWKAITTGTLIARWLMEPTGFEPVVGNRFTFKTTPAGAWDGLIRCEVLDVRENERFSYAWKGGDTANVGYGSPLDTMVTFTLTRVDGGTRLRLIHAGFVLPKNETAFTGMSEGWANVIRTIEGLAAEQG